MARNMAHDDAADIDRTHNATEQKAKLLDAANKIDRLEAEIAELQAEIRQIKHEEVKALGVKLADFNTVRRWRRLEAEERDQTLDNIRLCAEAMNIGMQPDLFPGRAAAAQEAA